MREHPRGGQTEIAIAIAIPIVVEIETVGVEVADIDAVAVRIDKIVCLHPQSPKEEKYHLFVSFFGSKQQRAVISAKDKQEVHLYL